MKVDINAVPATLDILHLTLGALAFLLVVLLLIKKKPATLVQTPAAPAVKEQPKQDPIQPALRTNSPDAALQLLSLLQQEARFVDFLNEDLKGFSDAEIGAVARVVHEGGNKTLKQYFKLEPVRAEDEESRVTLPAGFNASEVRVTGNVVGQPPFTGTLVHRGWRVTEVSLPKLADGHDARVIVPAEVEL